MSHDGTLVVDGSIPKRIVLIDGPRLAALMYDYGIGVRNKRALDVKTVDDTYFEGELPPATRA